MYMFLTTQADMSMCGRLVARERFWATAAAGLTYEDVHQAVTELASARFVVVDEDTQELLVRAKIRRDNVLAGPKLIKPLVSAIEQVGSEKLREVIAEELARCLAEGLVYPGIVPDVEDLIASLSKGLGGNFNSDSKHIATFAFPQVNTLSDRVSDRVPDRDRGSTYTAEPLNNHPEPPPTDLTEPPDTSRARVPARTRVPARGRKPKVGSDDDPRFTEFWNAYPRKTAKGTARAAWAKAILKARADPDDIIAAALAYAATPGLDPQYTPHPATWLNQERWADDPATAPSRMVGGQSASLAHNVYGPNGTTNI